MDEMQVRAALSDYRRAVIDAVRVDDDGPDERWGLDEAKDRELDMFEKLVARLRSEPPTEAGESEVDRESNLWVTLAQALNDLPYIDPYDDEIHLVDAAWRAVVNAASPPPSGEPTEADSSRDLREAYSRYLQTVDGAPRGDLFRTIERIVGWGTNASNPTESEGVSRIARERARQVSDEGWTPEHDSGHTDEILAIAAAELAVDGTDARIANPLVEDLCGSAAKFGRRGTKPDRVRALTIAGALIAAEIDRVLRMRTPPRPVRGRSRNGRSRSTLVDAWTRCSPPAAREVSVRTDLQERLEEAYGRDVETRVNGEPQDLHEIVLDQQRLIGEALEALGDREDADLQVPAPETDADHVAQAVRDDGFCGERFLNEHGEEAVCVLPRPCDAPHGRPDPDARYVVVTWKGWNVSRMPRLLTWDEATDTVDGLVRDDLYDRADLRILRVGPEPRVEPEVVMYPCRRCEEVEPVNREWLVRRLQEVNVTGEHLEEYSRAKFEYRAGSRSECWHSGLSMVEAVIVWWEAEKRRHVLSEPVGRAPTNPTKETNDASQQPVRPRHEGESERGSRGAVRGEGAGDQRPRSDREAPRRKADGQGRGRDPVSGGASGRESGDRPRTADRVGGDVVGSGEGVGSDADGPREPGDEIADGRASEFVGGLRLRRPEIGGRGFRADGRAVARAGRGSYANDPRGTDSAPDARAGRTRPSDLVSVVGAGAVLLVACGLACAGLIGIGALALALLGYEPASSAFENVSVWFSAGAVVCALALAGLGVAEAAWDRLTVPEWVRRGPRGP